MSSGTLLFRLRYNDVSVESQGGHVKQSSLIVLMLASMARSLSAGDLVYRDESCPVSFMYPASWSVATTREEAPGVCRVVLNPSGWEAMRLQADWPLPDNAITFDVLNEGLEEAAFEAGFARNESDAWEMVIGRGSYPAKPLVTPHLTGLAGSVFFRTWNEKGEPASGGYPVVLLNRGEWSVAVTGEWSPREPATMFDDLVNTIDLLTTTTTPDSSQSLEESPPSDTLPLKPLACGKTGDD
jgi:hypothetical protein